MKRPFLIVALPRSRTAWLSNLFTVGPVFCQHDLLYHAGGDPKAFAELLMEPDAEVCGAADSGAIFKLEEIQRELPRLKVFHVHRPFGECLSSMTSACELPVEQVEPVMADCFERIVEHHFYDDVVDFDALDTEYLMRHFWGNVTAGLAFPELHWQKMKRMHVMLKPSELLAVAHPTRQAVAA